MSLIGITDEQKIWNFLKSEINNEYGVAGIMGNLYAESGLKSNNLQNTYEKSFGYTDDEYVQAVDDNSYSNFVKDSAGFGLAQWTYYSRKQSLLNFAKESGESIGDLEMQLNFLLKELSENYKNVLLTLNNATSILEASNCFLFNFEIPSDKSESIQNKRASYSQKYFDKYKTNTIEATTINLNYSIGNIVDFIGSIHYSDSNTENGSTCKPGVAKITAISQNAKHPYHLIRESSGTSNVYGWVDVNTISGLYEIKREETNNMSNSSLVTYTKISPNRTSPRNNNIDTITVHCTAGNKNNTAQQILNISSFIVYNNVTGCSCNYAIGGDGSIGLGVEEKDRSWCSSSRENDHRAITIEVASNTSGTEVNDKAYAALIDLITDICKRNGINKLVWSENKNERVNHLNGCNMTVHRDYANKACPGAYLYDRHPAIAAEVNNRLCSGFEPYMVKITASVLNIRQGAGTNYSISGQIKDKGVYTIVEEANGDGATKWGLLKSKVGWISLDYATRL